MWIRAAAITAVLAGTAIGLVVAFPAAQRAPFQAGLCSAVTADAQGRAVFSPVAYDVENLETCGARLEAVRLLSNQPVSGAYQGVYVFADDEAIKVGPTLEGPHRELISRSDRTKIDAAIAELIRRRVAERERERGVSLELAPS